MAFGMEQYSRRKMCQHFTVTKKWSKQVVANAKKELPEGTQGDWQKESLFNEELDLVKCSTDLSDDAFLQLRAYCAGRSGNREGYKEEFQKNGRPSVWARIK